MADDRSSPATKGDLAELRGELKNDLGELRDEFKNNLGALKHELIEAIRDSQTEVPQGFLRVFANGSGALQTGRRCRNSSQAPHGHAGGVSSRG